MSPDIKAPGLDEARAALAVRDQEAIDYGWTEDVEVDVKHLRSALTAADRLATENARLQEALAWALGEGPDPGAWPDGVPLPSCASGAHEVLALRASTDADAPAYAYPPPFGDGVRGWKFRRTCAARRILAEVLLAF